MGRNPLPKDEKKIELRGIYVQPKVLDKIGSKKAKDLSRNAINNHYESLSLTPEMMRNLTDPTL